MIRRTAVTAFTALAMSPLLMRVADAQTAGAQTASGSAAQVRQRLAAASQFSLATSELAISQAQRPAVKTFAQFEAAEQRAEMQAMKVAGLNAPPPASLDAEKARMLQQLQELREAQFDQMYLRGQLTGHQELLQLHQALLSGGSREGQVIATMAIASIQQHLAMLQSMG